MSSKTPLVDVKAQYERLIPDILERMREVLDSGVFILGPNVQAFEHEAASYLGVPRTIGVANGTDALVLALDALGVGPGDEVICPAFTFYATAESIARRGATPVFADIDPATLNLDPEDVAAKVTERTRALMPVHLFGRVMPLGELAKLDVPIIEDAAQAFGAEGVATTGVLSTFSFFPTNNLFALGDGGLVAATDEELADRVALLRFHGSRQKKEFEAVGYNSRLDELQAAVLRVLLPELDGWIDRRRAAAEAYERLGLGEHVVLPRALDGARHAYHLYVVRSERELPLGRGYYRTPVHRQPAIASDAELPVTEEAARTNYALPMGIDLTEDQVREVVECVSGST
jgi:dTDP-4-amino-4,6-dideoxygalactose transaminase